MHTYKHASARTYMHTCIHETVYTDRHACMSVCIHTCMHTHTHTHTHKHAHTVTHVEHTRHRLLGASLLNDSRLFERLRLLPHHHSDQHSCAQTVKYINIAAVDTQQQPSGSSHMYDVILYIYIYIDIYIYIHTYIQIYIYIHTSAYISSRYTAAAICSM